MLANLAEGHTQTKKPDSARQGKTVAGKQTKKIALPSAIPNPRKRRTDKTRLTATTQPPKPKGKKTAQAEKYTRSR